MYSTTNYFKWSRRFKYILNAVVVYTDSEKFADLIKSVRSTTSTRTKVIVSDLKAAEVYLENLVSKGLELHHTKCRRENQCSMSCYGCYNESVVTVV